MFVVSRLKSYDKVKTVQYQKKSFYGRISFKLDIKVTNKEFNFVLRHCVSKMLC